MQHAETEYLGEWTEDVKTAVLELIPPQDGLRGLSAEDVVRGLGEQEPAQLRRLLERKRAD